MARYTIWFLLLLCTTLGAQTRTRNVIIVMADGLRWQEAFKGVDEALIDPKKDAALKQQFWRDSAEARREALMPFLWGVVAKNGQVYGNRDKGSEAYVTNGMNFSYPGYSEIVCGFGDPRIDSNGKRPNPNINVLEWLNAKPAFKNRVAAFGAWDLFPYILNAERSGLFVNAGMDPLTAIRSPRIDLLNRLKKETAIWSTEAMDAATFHTALEYFKQRKPRVLFLSLGETDEWAHEGRYDLYLRAIQLFDQYARELWDTAQSMKEYRGNTSLILAVDHGRGLAPVDWKSHGQKLPETKYVWFGFLGPDTPAKGERANIQPVTQSQIAATIAALLGENFTNDGKAGKPIAEVLGR